MAIELKEFTENNYKLIHQTDRLTGTEVALNTDINPSVGDSIMFCTRFIMPHKLVLNITTPLNATGVWEYITLNNPTGIFNQPADVEVWKPLPVISNQNILNNTGSQTIQFGKVQDWTTFYKFGSIGQTYTYHLRFRITAINTAQPLKIATSQNKYEAISVSSQADVTWDEVAAYTASINREDMVKKEGNSVVINSTFRLETTASMIMKNENITVIGGNKTLFNGSCRSGELVNGVAKNGCSLVYIGHNCSYYVVALKFVEFYDSSIRFLTDDTMLQGSWGSALGSATKLSTKDSSFYNFRNFSMSQPYTVLDNIKLGGHGEPMRCIIKNCTFVGAMTMRASSWTTTKPRHLYIHTSNTLPVTNNNIADFYRQCQTPQYRLSFIDCKIDPSKRLCDFRRLVSDDQSGISTQAAQQFNSVQLDFIDVNNNIVTEAKAALMTSSDQDITEVIDSNLQDNLSVKTSLLVSNGYLGHNEYTLESGGSFASGSTTKPDNIAFTVEDNSGNPSDSSIVSVDGKSDDPVTVDVLMYKSYPNNHILETPTGMDISSMPDLTITNQNDSFVVNKSAQPSFDISTATTVYVDVSTGDDSNDGSQANPYKSLYRAVRHQNASNLVVYVASGVYSGVNSFNNAAIYADNLAVIGLGTFTSEYVTGSTDGVFRALENKNYYFENCIFDKGETSGAIVSLNRTLHRTYSFKNCTFRNMPANGISIIGSSTTILENCVAENNVDDGFNYHNYSTSEAVFVLEINCIGRNNGLSTKTASNGSTAHDNVRIVRVNGLYEGNNNRNIHDINNSMSWNIGCISKNGKESGEGNWVVGTGDDTTSTKMWLDSCVSYGDINKDFDYFNSGANDVIYTRNVIDKAGIADTVTPTPYGTVNINPSTVKIVGATENDGSKIINGQGVWSVDPITGSITFTPEPKIKPYKGREVILTNGNDKGYRNIISEDSSNTALAMIEDNTKLVSGTTVVEVPYILTRYQKPKLDSILLPDTLVEIGEQKIRVRRYGYNDFELTSTFSEPLVQTVTLLSDLNAKLSRNGALAVNGVTVDYNNKTVTISQDIDSNSIYCYCMLDSENHMFDKSPLSYDGSKLKLENGWVFHKNANITDNVTIIGNLETNLNQLTDINVEGDVVFTNDAQLENVNITGTVSAPSAVTLGLITSTVGIIGSNITSNNLVRFKITGIVAGSNLRLYDINNNLVPYTANIPEEAEVLDVVGKVRLVTLSMAGYVAVRDVIDANASSYEAKQVIDKIEG